MISATTDLGLALANDLRPIVLRVARELRKETEQFGVTSRQATLLAVVKASPGLTLRALAEAEAISAPALSEQVDRLERAGLLRGCAPRSTGAASGSSSHRRASACSARSASGEPPGLQSDSARSTPMLCERSKRRSSRCASCSRTTAFELRRICVPHAHIQQPSASSQLRLFFTGQVFSLAGSWMQNVALAWLVISLSRSPLAVGLLLFCRFVPYTLFGLFAGSVVDRFETRLLVIWTQAAAMLVSAALAFVTLTGTATLPIVYLLATLGGIAFVLDGPGRQSLTFEMVGPRELPNAVALNSGLVNASRIIGPAIAGVIIAVAGVGLCFVVNTISFLAVLAALVAMRTAELYPVASDRTVTLLKGTREGLAFAWHDRQVRVVLVVMTCVGSSASTSTRSSAARLGHAARRRTRVRPALGGVRARSLLRRDRHRVLQAGDLQGVRVGTAGFSSLLIALAPATGMARRCPPGGHRRLVHALRRERERPRPARRTRPPRGRLVALYLFSFVGLAPSARSSR